MAHSDITPLFLACTVRLQAYIPNRLSHPTCKAVKAKAASRLGAEQYLHRPLRLSRWGGHDVFELFLQVTTWVVPLSCVSVVESHGLGTEMKCRWCTYE